MKPDYISNYDVDALIIGGYYGRGKFASQISKYLLAIVDTTSKDNGRYVSFCRVGTGLSEKERSQLESLVRPQLKKLKQPPRHYRLTGSSRETPNLWISQPSTSVVLQVNASIRCVPSTVFASGYTLRFPRVSAIRTDKGHEDIMTLQELTDLVSRHSGDLSTKKRKLSTPRKPGRSRKRVLSLPPQFQKSPMKTHKPRSDCLTGVIVNFGDYGPYDKVYVESLAQELGAVVYMSPSRGVDYVLGHDSNHPSLKRLAYNEKHDIVSIEWLLRCEAANKRIPLRPRDYLWRASEGVDSLAKLLDGEAPEAEPDEEDIRQVVEHHMDQFMIRNRFKSDIDDPYSPSNEITMEFMFPGSRILDGCVFYMICDSWSSVRCPSREIQRLLHLDQRHRMKLAGLRVQYTLMKYGGDWTTTLNETVTHLIFDSSSCSKMRTPESFLDWIATLTDSEVDHQWLYQSLDSGALFLIQSEWFSQERDVRELRDSERIAPYLPEFTKGSVVTEGERLRGKLLVDNWPWEEYISGWTPTIERAQQKRVLSTASPVQTQKVHSQSAAQIKRRSQKTTSSRYHTPESSSVSTSALNRVRPRGRMAGSPESDALQKNEEMDDVDSGTTDRSINSPYTLKLPSRSTRKNFFQIILEQPKSEETADIGDRHSSVGEDGRQRRNRCGESPSFVTTSSRLRSRCPERHETPEKHVVREKKTSAREKLRSLRRRE